MELIVEQRQAREDDACVEHLGAVRQRDSEADGDEGPAEDDGIAKRDAACGQRPVGFIARVLFNAEHLVRDVEVQEV